MPNQESHAERIGRLLQMHASERSEIKEVRAGDMCGGGRLEGRHHGRHAVGSRKRSSSLRRWNFPNPSSRWRSSQRPRSTRKRWASPATSGQRGSVVSRAYRCQESGQTIISGMGELHLEIIVDRMKREFKVDANVGKPQVAYRETIARHGSETRG